jgi:hypothetical protein
MPGWGGDGVIPNFCGGSGGEPRQVPAAAGGNGPACRTGNRGKAGGRFSETAVKASGSDFLGGDARFPYPGPQNRFQGHFRPGNGRFPTRASADPGGSRVPGGWSGAMV